MLDGATGSAEREGSGRAGPGQSGSEGGETDLMEWAGRRTRERELRGCVRGLYEPVHWAGVGRRVMSGGEWGPCAPGDWAMPEGAQEFQGWWAGQNFRGRDPAESLFFCQSDATHFNGL